MANQKNKQKAKFVLELRNIALVVTQEHKIAVRLDKKAKTACINLKNFHIVVTPNLHPKGLEKFPLLEKYAYHGQVLHEAGHYVLTLPIESRYERFEKRQKYPLLAKEVTNIVEDKRVNNFCILRYRFDLGKRLAFLMDLIRKSSKYATIEKFKAEQGAFSTLTLLIGGFVQKGLYNCDITPILKGLAKKDKEFAKEFAKGTFGKTKEIMSKKPTEDLKKLLSLLEKAKFMRVKWKLIDVSKKIYDILESYAIHDFTEKNGGLVPSWLGGGGLGGKVPPELQKELESMEKSERPEEKEDEAYSEGYGAGWGFGDEIPAPKPNFNAYQQLVSENSDEITKLLNMLKKTVKPTVKRAIWQKRGRIMSNILTKAYTSSLRRRVNKIYVSKQLEYEKEKVAIQFLIDFSGSMNKYTAQCVTTILNEVFGQWLTDDSYGISVFGANRQKIKTFYEQFNNTRARIGGISVNTAGTNISQCLLDSFRMFKGITEEKRKILVICSDFCFGDSVKAEETLKEILKYGIDVLAIGLCYYQDLQTLLPNEKGIQKTYVDNVKDLPQRFTEIYIKSVMGSSVKQKH